MSHLDNWRKNQANQTIDDEKRAGGTPAGRITWFLLGLKALQVAYLDETMTSPKFYLNLILYRSLKV
jgi:hypothetical protein